MRGMAEYLASAVAVIPFLLGAYGANSWPIQSKRPLAWRPRPLERRATLPSAQCNSRLAIELEMLIT